MFAKSYPSNIYFYICLLIPGLFTFSFLLALAAYFFEPVFYTLHLFYFVLSTLFEIFLFLLLFLFFFFSFWYFDLNLFVYFCFLFCKIYFLYNFTVLSFTVLCLLNFNFHLYLLYKSFPFIFLTIVLSTFSFEFLFFLQKYSIRLFYCSEFTKFFYCMWNGFSLPVNTFLYKVWYFSYSKFCIIFSFLNTLLCTVDFEKLLYKSFTILWFM